MSSQKHGRRLFCFRGCALLLMCCFVVSVQPSSAFSREESPVTFSIVTFQEGHTLEGLAKRYQTTVDQILLDNPSVKMKPGATLTVREKTVEEAPSVVEALSRGASLAWSWPAYARISSSYGWRKGEFHHGIDFAIPHGTDILAARDGTVVKAQWIDIYGQTVLLDHGNGVQSLYAHNQKLLVSPGDRVEQGDCIAISGDTGRSTGPHLHFEIRLNGNAVDPMPYLPKSS